MGLSWLVVYRQLTSREVATGPPASIFDQKINSHSPHDWGSRRKEKSPRNRPEPVERGVAARPAQTWIK
jgi:hypothetical protein